MTSLSCEGTLKIDMAWGARMTCAGPGFTYFIDFGESLKVFLSHFVTFRIAFHVLQLAPGMSFMKTT